MALGRRRTHAVIGFFTHVSLLRLSLQMLPTVFTWSHESIEALRRLHRTILAAFGVALVVLAVKIGQQAWGECAC